MTQITFLLLILVSITANASGSEIPSAGCDHRPPTSACPFEPGLVSTGQDEFGLSVSSNWQEIYFTRLVGETSAILTSTWQDGHWTTPVVASFSGSGNDGHPYIWPDGNHLSFSSHRPCPGAKDRLNIWVVTREEDSWSDPESPGSPFTNQTVHAPTVGPDGTIWDTGLVRFPAEGDGHLPRRRLDPPINGSHPTASPDGQWLIFAARAPGSKGGKDLYGLRMKNGIPTGKPQALLGDVNSSSNESSPTFSGDGSALFFSRNGNIQWIATSVALPRPENGAK